MYLRPLRRQAFALLRQAFLTPALLGGGPRVDPNTLPLDGPQGLVNIRAVGMIIDGKNFLLIIP